MSTGDRYKTGEVRVAREGYNSWHEWQLDEMDVEERAEYEVAPLVVVLPHQCDEWSIGGKAEVEQMIADLTEALSKLQ